MRRLLLTIYLLFLPMLWSPAQEEPEHSIDDLQQWIKESGRDTGRVMLLRDLAMQYVIRPGSHDSDMNRAISYTNRAMKLSRTLGYNRGAGLCCYVYSNICREQGKTERGQHYAQQAIDIFSRHGTYTDQGDAWLEASNYINPFSGDIAKKTQMNEKAAELFNKGGAKQKEASVLKTIGDLYYLVEKNEEALEITKRSLRIYQEIKYPKLQAVYDQVGAIYTELAQYNQAMKYGLLALKAAEQDKDSSALLCTIYNRLGTSHYYLDQTDKAAGYYRTALSLAIRNKDTLSIMIIANNITNVYQKAKRPMEAVAFLKPLEKNYRHTRAYKDAAMYKCLMMAYVQAKQYKLARPYVEEALLRTRDYGPDDPRRFWTDGYITDYYLGIGEYATAIRLCRNMERIAQKLNRVHNMKMVYYTWFQADSSSGNYFDALEHYKVFVNIRDSLNGARVRKETSQLLVQYETEKKEKDIQLLTKQSQLQKSLLQQATFMRNATLAGIIISLFFIGLLFSRYRLKQKSNKQLQLQQQEINEKNASLQHLLTEKEWLLKEIHHRIKNNLQTVMSLLSSQSAYLDNDAAVAAIRDSRHRIHAMSLIHQKLYTSENVSVIDMPLYIQELVGYMRDCFDTGQRIQFGIDITPLKLDVSQAIPLALILNEAITNSLKYAFPGDMQGIINILLKHQENNAYLLTIADNGVGIREEFPRQKGSLGMSLMKGLSEDLDGTFNIKNKNGTILEIQFIRDTDGIRTNQETLSIMNN